MIKNKEMFYFEDTEEDIERNCEYRINEILNKNKITSSQLIENKTILVKIINIMKEEYNYSLREIAEKLGVGRETIRKKYIQ